jgi:hypothetical protein
VSIVSNIAVRDPMSTPMHAYLPCSPVANPPTAPIHIIRGHTCPSGLVCVFFCECVMIILVCVLRVHFHSRMCLFVCMCACACLCGCFYRHTRQELLCILVCECVCNSMSCWPSLSCDVLVCLRARFLCLPACFGVFPIRMGPSPNPEHLHVT